MEAQRFAFKIRFLDGVLTHILRVGTILLVKIQTLTQIAANSPQLLPA